MTTEEYEQKKRECWDALHKELLDGEVQWQLVSRKEIVNFAFDRAYALGKQFGNSEQVDADTVIQGWVGRDMEQAFESGANIFIGRQEKEVHGMCLSDVKAKIDAWMESHTEEEVYECLKKYNAVEDEGTVIQGWVARNGSGPNDLGLHVYTVKPDRMKNRREWNGHGGISYLIDCGLFPDLTWESDPQPVEIIIKRKKNG